MGKQESVGSFIVRRTRRHLAEVRKITRIDTTSHALAQEIRALAPIRSNELSQREKMILVNALLKAHRNGAMHGVEVNKALYGGDGRTEAGINAAHAHGSKIAQEHARTILNHSYVRALPRETTKEIAAALLRLHAGGLSNVIEAYLG